MQHFEALFRRFGRNYPAGATIYEAGDPATEFFVVNAGAVRETRMMLGMEKLVRESMPGEFFGEIALIAGQERRSTARTNEDSRILVIPTSTFQAMVRANTEISVRLVRRMVLLIHRLQRDVGVLLFREPEARLASFLSQLEGDDPRVPLSRLGSELGLRPGETEELSQRFVRMGLARLDAGHLHVVDRQGLSEFLEFVRLRERFGPT